MLWSPRFSTTFYAPPPIFPFHTELRKSRREPAIAWSAPRQNDIVEKMCTVSKALEELRDEICPRTHQSEDRTKYLYKAVVGSHWAKKAQSMSLSADPPCTIHKLFTALDTAWLQNEEKMAARQRDGRSFTRNFGQDVRSHSKPPGLFWETPCGTYFMTAHFVPAPSCLHRTTSRILSDATRLVMDLLARTESTGYATTVDHIIRFCPSEKKDKSPTSLFTV